jgi:hypothetical protein
VEPELRFGFLALLYRQDIAYAGYQKFKGLVIMKSLSLPYVVVIGVVGLICSISSAWAQNNRRVHYSVWFNPATVGAVSGEVMRVEQALAGSGKDYCVHALLKTRKGQVTAILAPQSFMKEHKFVVAPNDRLTVTGSLISVQGKSFLVATEVTGDRTMKLREANGRPAWAIGDDWHIH